MSKKNQFIILILKKQTNKQTTLTCSTMYPLKLVAPVAKLSKDFQSDDSFQMRCMKIIRANNWMDWIGLDWIWEQIVLLIKCYILPSYIYYAL